MCLATKFSRGIFKDFFTDIKKGWNDAGLTLIELVVVLAIIGILILPLLAPASQILAESGLRHIAMTLVRDLRYVQQQQMQDPKAFWELQFIDDITNHKQYWRVNKLDPVQNTWVTQYTRELPAGISMTGIQSFSYKRAYFKETGEPINAGTVSLNNDHSQYSVAVAAISGRIRWVKVR
jgi:prepilin-type N-terminal cleavage/methylation domain-containing protein